MLENVPAAAAPWGFGERVRGGEGRGGNLTTRAAAVVPREAGCRFHGRSEAWGAPPRRTSFMSCSVRLFRRFSHPTGSLPDMLLVVRGERRALEADVAKAALSAFSTRRPRPRQVAPTDRAHEMLFSKSESASSRKASEALRNRARRGAPSNTRARVVLVEFRVSTRRLSRRLGAPSSTPRARLPGFEASSAVFSRREPRAFAPRRLP